MNKKAIRFTYRQKRAAISSSDKDLMSKEIQARFFADGRILARLGLPGAIVHTYLPIAQQNEVDTWPIIHQLWREFPQVRIWSSITNAETGTLQHFQLTPDTELIETNWGIPAPAGTFERVTGQPDLVIVPLLAFDKSGHRVGYGGGYYDRFLAETGSDCLKIGLSYFAPVDVIDDIEATDVRLDGCVSPEGTYMFVQGIFIKSC